MTRLNLLQSGWLRSKPYYTENLMWSGTWKFDSKKQKNQQSIIMLRMQKNYKNSGVFCETKCMLSFLKETFTSD